MTPSDLFLLALGPAIALAAGLIIYRLGIRSSRVGR